MNKTVLSAVDARQTPEWGTYLTKIGWIAEEVKGVIVLIKQLKPLPWSVIKILHPKGPLPLSQIDKIASKYNALAVILEPHVHKYDEKVLKKNGYITSSMRYAHSATIKIDLQPSHDNIWNSFSENARRNIRKAEKLGIRLEKFFLKNEKNNKHFDRFYELLLNLHKLKKFYIPSYEEYIKKMEAFKNTSLLLFAYEKKGEKPIAAIWLAHYKNVISYLQTGITEQGYKTYANYLLVWEALKLAKELGLEVFDFESIYDPRYPKDHIGWKGYTEFKKRFHGEIIEYPPSWIKIYNPVFKVFYLCTSIFSN